MARDVFTGSAADPGAAGRTGVRDVARRRSTETKAAFKTTEFVAFLVAVAAVLIATAVVDEGNAGGLGARQGWTLVAALAIGYMVSRGLAKSGSREPYSEHEDR